MADQAWQEAWVEILPDISKFSEKANKEITSSLSKAGDKGSKSYAAAFGERFSSRIGEVFTGTFLANAVLNIATSAGRAIGDAIGTGINIALEGINLASDLSESANAVQVSFGAAADGIAKLGEDASTRLALTRAEFNGIATQFSAFAKTIVGDGGDVVGLIDELTTRGADFASVYNIEVSEALALFQSGLAGETEPLRKYGIDLSAATVNAYAYANGIAEQGKQLTEAQRVQAAYGTLLAQTNQVTGDFANTSGGLANQQKILDARLKEAQTTLGTALLPTMTELVTLANDTLIPALNGVIQEIGPELAEALGESMPAFRELLIAIVPLLPELVKLGTSILPPILRILIALSPLLIDWASNTATVLEAAQALYSFLAGETTLEETDQKLAMLGGSFSAFANLLNTVLTDAAGEFNNFSIDVADGVNQVASYIGGLPDQITAELASVPTLLVQAGKDLINGFITGVQSMATKLAEAALKPVKDAVKGVKDFLQIKSPSKLFEQFGVYTAEGYIKGVDSESSNVASSLRSMVAVPAMSAYGAAAFSPQTVPVGAPSGGFNNYGTIQVTDEAALVDEVEKGKRRAYAAAGLNGLRVA